MLGSAISNAKFTVVTFSDIKQLPQLRRRNPDGSVASHGIAEAGTRQQNYQADLKIISLISDSGQRECTLTGSGVILAISKHDESSSTIYAREVDTDFNGNGYPFQLQSNRNGFIWENNHIAAENLFCGCLVTYKDGAYCSKIDVKPQDPTKIQMDLDYGEGAFAGISDAFPLAKCHKKGLSIDEVPKPSIAAISMTTAFIKNERIQFTTRRGEVVNLRLLCRENLLLSTSSVNLQLRSTTGDEDVGDLALVKFETHPSTRHVQLTYWAVCVGLILRFKPTVISITEEPVEVKDGNGRWMRVPGDVLFDTGNKSQTAISGELVDKLDLQPDRRKLRKVVAAGDIQLQCSTVDIEVNVRNNKFKVEALVGATAPPTDLLIGSDIINPLTEKKYTFGE